MTDDFYEDDEPVERVREAFVSGDKGVTGRLLPEPYVVTLSGAVGELNIAGNFVFKPDTYMGVNLG